ncbi:MAG: hypothetical protein ACRDH9_01495 [Actinomycetota bacterium]
MEIDLLAQVSRCSDTCGIMVLVAAMILFPGTVWMLTGAVAGNRMGYLISATSFFAFMVILTALWTFGAPGTPRYTGPKGDLPGWATLAAGVDLESKAIPLIDEYPGGRWKTAKEAGLVPEIEPATLAFQDFVAEEAAAELVDAGMEVEVEVPSTEFVVEGLRFAEIDGRPFAMARAFSGAGGPEVLVAGYKDPGNEPLPSYFALGLSLIGFVVHLPFLDRAERKRKDLLTGGGQPTFRGPA